MRYNNVMHSMYLQQACELAKTRRGRCAPNPAVGAIIVRDGQVIARGVTQDPGFDHAEVDAIKKLSLDMTRSATLYVTLEPCCHFGRTPPCTDAIIASGIKAVYYGYRDPNPAVNGGGALALRAAGIDCHYLPMEEIDYFYESYAYWVATGRPWVTAKLAMSLDGKIAGRDGKPIAITSTEAKALTFDCRESSDAILTTAQTVINDDPKLSIRKKNSPEQFRPIYLLDRSLRTPISASIFGNTLKNTVFYSSEFSSKLSTQSDDDHIRYLAIDEHDGGLDLLAAIARIGQDGIHNLWVEAGSRLFNALMQENMVHRALVYIAPKLIHHGIDAFDQQSNWAQAANSVTWYHKGPDGILDMRFAPPKSLSEVI